MGEVNSGLPLVVEETSSAEKSHMMEKPCMGETPGLVTLLSISLVINLCLVIYILVSRLVQAMSSRLSSQWQDKHWAQPIATFCDQQHVYTCKLLLEKVTILPLLGVTIYTLVTTDVIHKPFFASEYSSIVNPILGANVGRYLFLTGLEFRQGKKGGMWWVWFIHHTMALVFYLVAATTNENYLLCFTGIGMEVSTFLTSLLQIMKRSGIIPRMSVFRTLTIAACVQTFVLRVVIPGMIFCYAASRQHPLKMTSLSIAVTFFSLAFFFIVNLYLTLKPQMDYSQIEKKTRLDTLRSRLNLEDHDHPKHPFALYNPLFPDTLKTVAIPSVNLQNHKQNLNNNLREKVVEVNEINKTLLLKISSDISEASETASGDSDCTGAGWHDINLSTPTDNTHITLASDNQGPQS